MQRDDTGPSSRTVAGSFALRSLRRKEIRLFVSNNREQVGFSQVSVKRRRALQECNPLSNNRKARLHTAAEGGGVKALPPEVLLDSLPVLLLPEVRAEWLRKLPQAIEAEG